MAVFPKATSRFNENAYQNLNIFFHKWKANPKIHAKLQGSPNNQHNLEKEEQSQRNHTSKFHNLNQRYSNQNNVVPA